MSYLLLLVLLLVTPSSEATRPSTSKTTTLDHWDIDDFVTVDKDDNKFNGTKWAVLIAGSNGIENYRHQSDICHAYQLLKKGGLKDENIVVFMYDDIAYDEGNPVKGVIINHPEGKDVYAGVPKDYIGKDVNVDNIFAVILGNKLALTGGSGKVVNSGPSDHIFIFYADHGSAGSLGLPDTEDNGVIFADEFNNVLKKKYSTNSYKQMLIYVEACESGSIFEGLLSNDMNIYVTTAANARESSWATYCPGDDSDEYPVCLGDLYSVSWMEDSDANDPSSESVKQQYNKVKTRTNMSHVTQFGDKYLGNKKLNMFFGSKLHGNRTISTESSPSSYKTVSQYDADLIYFWNKFRRAPEGSLSKVEAQKRLFKVLAHRERVDSSFERIGEMLFGSTKGLEVMRGVRAAGQPLVDDWSCLKAIVRTYGAHCGPLSEYGRKHMRALANLCNAGISLETMAQVLARACPSTTSYY